MWIHVRVLCLDMETGRADQAMNAFTPVHAQGDTPALSLTRTYQRIPYRQKQTRTDTRIRQLNTYPTIQACNVSSCAWDHGDCLGATSYGANPNRHARSLSLALTPWLSFVWM